MTTLAQNDELHEEIKQSKEESQMSIITTAERIGMKKGREEGIEQGIEQGIREMISDILEIKFGVAGLALYDQMAQITGLEALRKFRAGLKQTRSVEEAEALIQAYITVFGAK